MPTMLLRLAGPLQSWGVESKFETRRTQSYPTKSGVIGLLAAALGYPRDAPLERLNTLNFGVRVDQEGELLSDYHMAKGKKDKDIYITNRLYLADAVFLVGLESENPAFLQELEEAIKNPVFPLFLGRRSCVPTMPIFLGIRDTSLLDALRNEKWLVSEWRQGRNRNNPPKKLRIIVDAEVPNPSSLVKDLPLSFNKDHREFGLRSVRQEYHEIQGKKQDKPQEHDAFSELDRSKQE